MVSTLGLGKVGVGGGGGVQFSYEIILGGYSFHTPHFSEPRFNEPLYNEVCGITNNFLYPGSDNKMYEKEPRYNKTSL